MIPFRSEIKPYYSDSICIKVIGYGQLFQKEVHSPSGVNDYFIFLLPKGSWYYLNNQKQEIKKPAIIIQPPNTSIHHGKDGGLNRSWMRFNGKKVEDLCRLNDIKINTLYEIDSMEEHEEYLLQLYQEIHHPRGHSNQNVVNLFTNWLRSIKRDASTLSTIPEKLSLAREYIEQNFTEKIGLQEISLASGLTRNNLCRYFMEFYKTSPMQYAISLRISLAKELLYNKALNLDVIGELSGFNDQYYFSKCFKKHTGKTPGEYRMNHSRK